MPTVSVSKRISKMWLSGVASPCGSNVSKPRRDNSNADSRLHWPDATFSLAYSGMDFAMYSANTASLMGNRVVMHGISNLGREHDMGSKLCPKFLQQLGLHELIIVCDLQRDDAFPGERLRVLAADA